MISNNIKILFNLVLFQHQIVIHLSIKKIVEKLKMTTRNISKIHRMIQSFFLIILMSAIVIPKEVSYIVWIDKRFYVWELQYGQLYQIKKIVKY